MATRTPKKFRPFDLGGAQNPVRKALAVHEAQFGFAPREQPTDLLWGVSLFNRKWAEAYFLTFMLGVIRYSGTLLIGDALHKYNLLGVLYTVYCVDAPQERKEALRRFLTTSCRFDEASPDLEKTVNELESQRDNFLKVVDSEIKKTDEPSEQSDEPYSFIFDAIPEALRTWLEEQAIQLGNRWLQENSTAILLAIWLIDKDSRQSLSAEEWAGWSAEQKIDYVNRAYDEKKLPFNIIRWADWVNRKDESYQAAERDYLIEMRKPGALTAAALEDSKKSTRHVTEQLKKILSLSDNAEVKHDENATRIFSEYMKAEGLQLTLLPYSKGYSRVFYPGEASHLIAALQKRFSGRSSEWSPIDFERNNKKRCPPEALFSIVLGPEGRKLLKDYLDDKVLKLIDENYFTDASSAGNGIKQIADRTLSRTTLDWNREPTPAEIDRAAKWFPASSRSQPPAHNIDTLATRIEDFKEGFDEISKRPIDSQGEIKIIVNMGIEILKSPVIQAQLELTAQNEDLNLKAWDFFEKIVWPILQLVMGNKFFKKQFALDENTLSPENFTNQLEQVKVAELINLGNNLPFVKQRLLFKVKIAALFFETYLKQISNKIDIKADDQQKLVNIGRDMGWIFLMIFSREIDLLDQFCKENISEVALISSWREDVEATIANVKKMAESLINKYFSDSQLSSGIYTAFSRSYPMSSGLDPAVSNVMAPNHSLHSPSNDTQSEERNGPPLTPNSRVPYQYSTSHHHRMCMWSGGKDDKPTNEGLSDEECYRASGVLVEQQA